MKKSQVSVHEPLLFRIATFFNAKPIEIVFLLIILAVSLFLRTYRIADYMTFLGDEGRDAIVVRRFLVNFDPILIGPGTSIGNMYLGPLYYYLMAIPLLVANFSPVGPALMVAFFGVATVFLVWKVSREWFPLTLQSATFKGSTLQGIHVGALVASMLYATSSIVVHFSRSSWNPNVMPFFALMTIYSVWRVWQKREFAWLIAAGISFAFVLQSHYLGLLILPIIAFFWTLTFYEVNKLPLKIKKPQNNFLIKYSLIGLFAFSFLMSPILLFDVRHNFMNTNALKVFLTERQTTVSARPWTAMPKIPEIASQISTSLFGGGSEIVGNIVSIVLALFIITFALQKLVTKSWFKEETSKSLLLIILWIAMGLVGLGVYKQHIYDHYFGFLFPAPFILIGLFVEELRNWTQKKSISLKVILSFAVSILISCLIVLNLKSSWIYKVPGSQLERSIAVSKMMTDESDGKIFNMAVIAQTNYEGAYQYFLEKENANFVMIDPQREKETVADQLFVVCELPREKCDPTTNPKAGIANFGWSRVDDEWEINGVILYKLVHNI